MTVTTGIDSIVDGVESGDRMGSDNVRTVFARWGHLPDPSFRVLLFMALVSMDNDDPPWFCLGQEALALALGRMIPEKPATSDTSKRAEEYRKARDADFRAVKRALTPLFRDKVVETLRSPGPGVKAVYGLHLDAPNGGRAVSPTGDVSWQDGGRSVAERGTPDVPRVGGGQGGVSFEIKGLQRMSNTKTKSPLPGTSPGAVDNSPPENDDELLEMRYSDAQRILGSLPDLGAEYMNQLAAIEGLRNRVIAAAAVAQSNPHHREGKTS
jgi:hypothetical protein